MSRYVGILCATTVNNNFYTYISTTSDKIGSGFYNNKVAWVNIQSDMQVLNDS